MLRDIIKKEILDNILSLKFVFTFLLCTVLILLSVYMGIANYLVEKREHVASVALNRQVIENQTQPMEVWENIIIYRPPQNLGTIVNGIEWAVGRATRVPKIYGAPQLTESKFGSNPIFAAFGVLDLMFIVKIVLSLLAILFTYDAIAGEKEKGTLKLALSNSVPRDRLILGKVIGGYISMLLPLLVPLLLSMIVLKLTPGLGLSNSDWIRMSLIFFMFLVYLSVFFSLGLFVSARTLHSSTSFLILLFIWTVFVMVIPKVAVVTAGQVKPVPSIHEITTKKSAITSQNMQETTKIMTDWMRKHLTPAGTENMKALDDSFNKFMDEATKEMSLRTHKRLDALDADYQLRQRAQQKLAINLSRISPASALTFGSMSLARTGIDERDRFLDAVLSYKQVFINWYKSRDTYRNPMAKPTRIKLDDMPRYSYEPENLRASLLRALPDFGIMFAMIVVFLFGSYISFLRYDIR